LRRGATIASAAVVFAVALTLALEGRAGALASLLAGLALVTLMLAWLDGTNASAKEVTVVATVAAAAAAGRVLFAAVPDVQPVTVVVTAAGAALGLRAGVAVGATAALASNFFLGQGPWTAWQMLAWGGCGAVGAAAASALRRRGPFAVLCFVLAYAYGFVLDFWNWYAFYPHTWASFVVRQSAGLPFNTAHAIGNVLLALVAGPELRRLLERYRRRLRTEVVWA
jgi:energy-coupling factor transport system substrate-specific component